MYAPKIDLQNPFDRFRLAALLVWGRGEGGGTRESEKGSRGGGGEGETGEAGGGGAGCQWIAEDGGRCRRVTMAQSTA